MEECPIARGNEDTSSVEFEIAFYENLLKARPHFIECMKVLAELYTKTGRYHKGLSLDKRLAELAPVDATVFYNLACSYSLTGDIGQSLESLKKTIELGFTDFQYLKSDPDLANARKDKRFYALIPYEPAT